MLYLPTVAGSFVSATVGAALGLADWGQLAFGAGLFSWLAMESVLLHRLLTGTEKPDALRPTLGIQLAPAPVGAVAYLSAGGGAPDLLAHALIGYGLLQVLVLKDRCIRVNAISPGVTETAGLNELFGGGDQAKGTKDYLAGQIPAGRIGQPEEIANAVLFLASDEASFVNNVELFVDG